VEAVDDRADEQLELGGGVALGGQHGAGVGEQGEHLVAGRRAVESDDLLLDGAAAALTR
jgi:hypothetical protein